jgi:hypothetical protein
VDRSNVIEIDAQIHKILPKLNLQPKCSGKKKQLKHWQMVDNNYHFLEQIVESIGKFAQELKNRHGFPH